MYGSKQRYGSDPSQMYGSWDGSFFFFSPGPGIAGHLRGECCHIRSPREQVGRTCFSGVSSPLQRSKEDTTTNKTFNLSDLDLKAPAMSGHPRGHPCKSPGLAAKQKPRNVAPTLLERSYCREGCAAANWGNQALGYNFP